MIPTGRLAKAACGAIAAALVAAAIGASPVRAEEKKTVAAAAAPAKTLYQRLGGYDALAAVTDDFIGRLVADPSLAPFFKGHGAESLKKIRQLIVDQLCALTGGPCYYTGRDMKAAHAGMGISQYNWDVTVKHLLATFDQFNVPQAEREEVLAAIAKTHDDIVETK